MSEKINNIEHELDEVAFGSEKLIDDISREKELISETLGITGKELEIEFDEYIVDKAEDTIDKSTQNGIVSDSELQNINHDVGEVIVQSVIEKTTELPDGDVETPVETFSNDGYAREACEVTDRLGEQRVNGFSIGSVIEIIMKNIQRKHGEYKVHKAKKLLSDDNLENAYKFNALVESGKFDINDDRIRSLYLSALCRKDEIEPRDIEEAVARGVSIEKMANDESFVAAVINQFVNQAGSQIEKDKKRDVGEKSIWLDGVPKLGYSFPYSNTPELIDEIIKNPKYMDKIKSSLDIQDYGNRAIHNDLLFLSDAHYMDEENSERRQEVQRNINFLKKLGFSPFAEDSDIESILFARKFFGTNIQRSLSELGLIDTQTVDRMYAIKLDFMKRYAQGELKEDEIPYIISDFEPSEGNEAANYWRLQSINIGKDAMRFVMSRLQDKTKSQDIFGENQHSEYGTGEQVSEPLFDKNGLPTDALFDDQSELLRAVKYYNREGKAERKYGDEAEYDVDIMKFLSQNIGRLNDENKGFVQTWNNLLTDEARKSFMLYATGMHNIDKHLFDENGVTENFSKSQLSYMKFVDKYNNPGLSGVIHSLAISGNKVEVFFDEFGPKEELSEELLRTDSYFYLAEIPELREKMSTDQKSELVEKLLKSRTEPLIKALQRDEELFDLLSVQQRQYMEFLEKTEYEPFLLNICDDIDSFFDSQGPTNELYILLFDQGIFDSRTEIKPPENLLPILSRHFEQTDESYRQYRSAINLGIESDEISRVGEAYSELVRRTPLIELDKIDYVNGKLLSEKVISTLGWDRLEEVIYYDSGASEMIAKMSEQELGGLNDWLVYLDELKIYNNNPQRLTALGILNYRDSSSLIENLKGINLDEDAKKNLSILLETRNPYQAKTYEELCEYAEFVSQSLKSDLNSDDIDRVKNAAINLLSIGGGSESPMYQMDTWRAVDGYTEMLVEQGIINEKDVALIELVRAINSAASADDVRRMVEGINVDQSLTVGGAFDAIVEKIKRSTNEQFKSEMFDFSAMGDGIEHSSISGSDGNDINVVLLNGAPFKLLSHTIYHYDPGNAAISSKLSLDPSSWNKAHGASTISTSLISEKNLRYVPDSLYYGFTDYPEDAIIHMGPKDIYVSHGKGVFDTSVKTKFPFVSPDQLIESSIKLNSSYNEVVLRRNAGDPDMYDGRLQPSCVIVHGNDIASINEQSKQAAEYFKVPIIIINDSAYNE